MSCTLAARDPKSRECRWCGSALTGRQLRWCGDDCARQMGRNHWWTSARPEALIRATGLSRKLLERLRNAAGFHWTYFVRCDQCGVMGASYEVNHVEPRNGRGYDTGCHHHQANLQVLCHGCHVAETTRQRRERPIWDAFESGAITADEAQQALDRAYWWKRGLPNPDVAPMDSLWAVA